MLVHKGTYAMTFEGGGSAIAASASCPSALSSSGSSSTLSLESEDGRHRATLHDGEVLLGMVRTVHRGWTGDTPIELIVFYAGAKGTPTAVKTR